MAKVYAKLEIDEREQDNARRKIMRRKNFEERREQILEALREVNMLFFFVSLLELISLHFANNMYLYS